MKSLPLQFPFALKACFETIIGAFTLLCSFFLVEFAKGNASLEPTYPLPYLSLSPPPFPPKILHLNHSHFKFRMKCLNAAGGWAWEVVLECIFRFCAILVREKGFSIKRGWQGLGVDIKNMK